MKPTRAQTYYELLEVSVSASREQIQQAYARLVQLCADQELALYGLASPAHAAELRAQLTEALEFLSDDELRAEYDKSIGLPPREKPASTAPQVPFTYEAPRASSPPPVTEQLLPSSASSSAPAAAAEVVVSVSAAPSEPRPPPELRPAPEPVTPVADPVALTVRPPPSAAPELAQESALAIARSSPPRPAPPPVVVEPTRPAPFVVPDGAALDGALLRKAREHRGVTLAALAEKTRIGTKYLESLELERYDALPAVVYVRGFLMAACKELGLDGVSLSRAYLAKLEQHRAKR